MSTEKQYSSEDEDQDTCHTCGDSLRNDDEDLCKMAKTISDGAMMLDDKGHRCYWDDVEEGWIEDSRYASARFIALLATLDGFEGWDYTCRTCGDSLRNDDEDLCEDCREIKDKRIKEFMKWQMELFIQLKAKKITHEEGMIMMKEKYPEFTPDDSEDESD